jgi:hypothetical protein
MKIKSENPLVLAVAKYYGITTDDAFKSWLKLMNGNCKIHYKRSEGGIGDVRVLRIKKLYLREYYESKGCIFVDE